MQGQARPVSQTVKTSPSHGEDMGSIPVRVTNDSLVLLDSRRIPIALGMRIFFAYTLCAVSLERLDLLILMGIR